MQVITKNIYTIEKEKKNMCLLWTMLLMVCVYMLFVLFPKERCSDGAGSDLKCIKLFYPSFTDAKSIAIIICFGG